MNLLNLFMANPLLCVFQAVQICNGIDLITGKVIFHKRVSRILSTGGGGCASQHAPGIGVSAPLPHDGHCSRRYASYCNTFLFKVLKS